MFCYLIFKQPCIIHAILIFWNNGGRITRTTKIQKVFKNTILKASVNNTVSLIFYLKKILH